MMLIVFIYHKYQFYDINFTAVENRRQWLVDYGCQMGAEEYPKLRSEGIRRSIGRRKK